MNNRFFSVNLFLFLSLMASAEEKVISYLQIYDIDKHQNEIICSFPYLIEAPNWTPDGKWIVFNSGGKLFKILSTGQGDPSEISTGFATNCNNDHVISADGSFIGISHAEGDWKTSRVYTIPFEGGVPMEITPDYPSFLHGISPDGREVAYCAFRGDAKSVCVKKIKNGKERILTTSPGLNDGPEYAPNGKQIWFNSVRSGLMQVWRMNRDGSKQTQMTFDEDLNSWFPHISPDGKSVVYIAYHKGDLAPDEHVPNKFVQLRLIKADGGDSHKLVDLFGGQGTINVNSWAPDSHRFAYVSYDVVHEWYFENLKGWTYEHQDTASTCGCVARDNLLHITTRANTYDRQKLHTRERIYCGGTYNWRTFIPNINKGDQVSIGSWIYHDDKHELDFEVGYGTQQAREACKATEKDLVVYMTNQGHPYFTKCMPIKPGWHDFSIVLDASKGNYRAQWLIDGQIMQDRELEFSEEIPFYIYCSVENLKFLGDHIPTDNYTGMFSNVSFKGHIR